MKIFFKLNVSKSILTSENILWKAQSKIYFFILLQLSISKKHFLCMEKCYEILDLKDNNKKKGRNKVFYHNFSEE